MQGKGVEAVRQYMMLPHVAAWERPLQRHVQYFKSTAQTIFGQSHCILHTSSMSPEKVKKVGKLYFGTDYVKLPSCKHQKLTINLAVDDPYDGLLHQQVPGCVYPRAEYMLRLWDIGLYWSWIGATDDEAFGPFLHASAYAWSMYKCNTGQNDFNYVTVADGWHAFYEMYYGKLLAVLRTRHQNIETFSPPSKSDMDQLRQFLAHKRSGAVSGKVNDGQFWSFMQVSHDIHAFRYFSSRMARTDLSEAESLAPASRLSASELLQQCNANHASNAYSIRRLSFIQIDNEQQECCPRECTAMASVVSGDNDDENCCMVCNRHRCRLLLPDTDHDRHNVTSTNKGVDIEVQVIYHDVS